MYKSWILLLVLVAGTACLADTVPSADRAQDPLETNYEDRFYLSSSEKFPNQEKKNEDVIQYAGEDSNEQGGSVETGDWDEEQNLGNPDSYIDEELKALSIHDNENENEGDLKDLLDYGSYDLEDFDSLSVKNEDSDIPKADTLSEVNENSLYDKEMPVDENVSFHNENDFVRPIEEPIRDDGSSDQIVPYDYQEEMELLPLPPTANVEADDFSNETKTILDKDDEESMDLAVAGSEQDAVQSDIDDINGETLKILSETDDSFDEELKNVLSDKLAPSEDSISAEKNNDTNAVKNESFDTVSMDKQKGQEDTVDAVEADVDADFQKLLDTMHSLSEDAVNFGETNDFGDEIKDQDEEDERDNQNDYEELADDDVSKLFKDLLSSQGTFNIRDGNDDKDTNSNEEINSDENDDVLEENLKDLLYVMSHSIEDQNSGEFVNDVIEGTDNKTNADAEIFLISKSEEPKSDDKHLLYGNDGLPAVENDDHREKIPSEITPEQRKSTDEDPDDVPVVNDVQKIDTTTEKVFDAAKSGEVIPEIQPTDSTQTERVEPITMSVETLSADEYDQLMTQFTQIFNESRNDAAVDCDNNPGQFHISVGVGETVEVKSCRHPDPYPTNMVNEWIVSGARPGLELVVRSLNVNGALGDYLLIRPDGLDDSAKEGLVFSFHLTEERRYRFLDLKSLLIRFVANPSFNFRNGFSLTIRNLPPSVEETTPEPEPEPEALIPAPRSTITLALQGMDPEQFLSIEEEFRRLLADMATMYINANDIHPGQYTTMETTKITSRSVCNVNWPGYRNCTEIRFGVTLVYEKTPAAELSTQHLRSMWTTYSQRDPFTARLRTLGITEFDAPDDVSALMVWLVVATGVVISMAMLSFALWRYSCFEKYTRMTPFTDTDSIKDEKRTLDLYPTPHQTLPPLYSEADFKWADGKHGDTSRVDMDGFTNKSYSQDGRYQLDSDDDVIITANRNTSIRPKDIYQV